MTHPPRLHPLRSGFRVRPRRADRARVRLSPEALEPRCLLAADPSTFARYDISGAASHPASTVMQVNPAQFTMPRGGLVLGFALQDVSGTPSGTVPMAMTPKGGARDQVLLQNRQPVGATSVMVARVGPGAFDLAMSPHPAASGMLQVDAYLPGDVNGDHQVTASDLSTIRALMGTHFGQPGYSLAADPNRDGVISARDYVMARMDLGASTTLQPLDVTAALAPSSNPDGNGVVTRPDVTIVGRTAPGATVLLMPGSGGTTLQTTTADGRGNYQFAVTLGVGVTNFLVQAEDGSQQAATSLSVTRGDVVIAWDQTMLDAIRADKDTLGLATRTMAMTQAAVYDAVNAIDHIGTPYQITINAPAGASPEAAAAAAAYGVLLAAFPDQLARFNATLADTLSSVPDGPAKAEGLAVGARAAAGIIAARADDGSDVQVPYVPGNAPGQWRPTPPDFNVAWGPEWGQVTPFAIPSAAPFLPPPPPPLNSPEYAAALKQAESLGALHSTTRTPEETLIGKFWGYDIAGVGPPPVHYNQILADVALQMHNTLDQNARLFALADLAMADAGVVAWDAKFLYNLWRPITAIRLANTDGNPATTADPSWTPLGAPGDGVVPNFTPPFPSYVSGHAAFGGALFTTLADFYGTDNVTFTIGSDETPGVYRTFHSFSAASEENGQSRIYLGIHFEFDKTAGIDAGDAVGNYVFQHTLTPAG